MADQTKDTPAFPCTSQLGMTLRQWYAGLALQGLISSNRGGLNMPGIESIAKAAALFADSMIRELTE